MALTVVGSLTPPQQSRATQRRIYTVSDPTIGTDWSVTVPAGEVWQLQAVICALVTSAVVGVRSSEVILRPFGQAVYRVMPITNQSASTGISYSYWPGAVALQVATDVVAPLPNVLLPPGSTFGSGTANLQSGDQWFAVALDALVYL